MRKNCSFSALRSGWVARPARLCPKSSDRTHHSPQLGTPRNRGPTNLPALTWSCFHCPWVWDETSRVHLKGCRCLLPLQCSRRFSGTNTSSSAQCVCSEMAIWLLVKTVSPDSADPPWEVCAQTPDTAVVHMEPTFANRGFIGGRGVVVLGASDSFHPYECF